MDLRLGTSSGVDAIKAIRKDDPEARVIVLTMYEGDEDIFRAHQAGATTYLLKDTLSSDLVRVVREVHAGERPVLPEVQARLAERASMPTLTSREIEVLQLISQGLRNKEVGAMLGITEGTVQIHVKNIFAKLERERPDRRRAGGGAARADSHALTPSASPASLTERRDPE